MGKPRKSHCKGARIKGPWLGLEGRFTGANQMAGSCHLSWYGLKGYIIGFTPITGSCNLLCLVFKRHFAGTNQMTSSCHLSWLGLKGRHMGSNHMTGSCQLLLFGWFLLRTGSFDDAIWLFSGLSLLSYHLPPGVL